MLGEPTLDLVQGLLGALFFGGISLMFVGWITLSIGGLIGFFYKSFLIEKVNR